MYVPANSHVHCLAFGSGFFLLTGREVVSEKAMQDGEYKGEVNACPPDFDSMQPPAKAARII